MDNVKFGPEERKRMLEFTAQALGAGKAEWTDRELLLNYNKALAMMVLAIGKKIRG